MPSNTETDQHHQILRSTISCSLRVRGIPSVDRPQPPRRARVPRGPGSAKTLVSIETPPAGAHVAIRLPKSPKSSSPILARSSAQLTKQGYPRPACWSLASEPHTLALDAQGAFRHCRAASQTFGKSLKSTDHVSDISPAFLLRETTRGMRDAGQVLPSNSRHDANCNLQTPGSARIQNLHSSVPSHVVVVDFKYAPSSAARVNAGPV